MFHKMQTKVLTAVSILLILLATTITILFYNRSATMIEDNYIESQSSQIVQKAQTLDNTFEKIYVQVVQAAVSSELVDLTQNVLQEGDSEQAASRLAASLRELRATIPDASSLFLLFPAQKMLITSKDYPAVRSDLSENTVETIVAAASQPMTPVLLTDPSLSTSSILALISPVQSDGKTIGYLMGNLDERKLYYDYLSSFNKDQIQAVLVDDHSQVVSSPNRRTVGELFKNGTLSTVNGTTASHNQDGQSISITHRAPFSGLRFFLETPKKEILQDLHELRLFLVAILLAVLMMAGAAVVLVLRRMYKPMEQLADTMRQVSDGELEIRSAVTSQDEIGELSAALNHMLDQIQDLIEQVLKEELLKKDAELNALQYQITPHFMYNTLNSIKYKALLKGENEIAALIDDFIELLQASINRKGAFVTLAEEIHFIQSYMALQQMRYEDPIETKYSIPLQAEKCYVPRLLLQPFIENAILHGLDFKNHLNHIDVKAWIEEDRLWLLIHNTGRPITEEQIQKMMAADLKKTHGLSGIGIRNVMERLELYYGRHAGIYFESDEISTTVKISLPITYDPERYALGHQETRRKKA